MNFEGKRVLVTGSTAGIGRGTAELFLEAGATVAINGRKEEVVARTVRELGTPQALAAAGAMPQRLLWASTGVKDKSFPDTKYVVDLVAKDTVNTMPEKTLLAFGQHGSIAKPIPRDGGDCEQVLSEFTKAGIDLIKLAADLQSEGAKSFDESWQDLLKSIDTKSKALR